MSRRTRASGPQPRATIVDIARESGVAPSTVSNALSGRRYVDPDTTARIKAAALKLGYNPNRRAQLLRTGSADTIALISSMPFAVAAGPSRLGFLMEIAAVAAAVALEQGMALVLVPPLEGGMPPVDGLAIDGAIVIEPERDDPVVARLRALGMPVVSIGRQLEADPPLPHVDLNSKASTLLLLDHLAETGAGAIALLMGAASRNSYAETQAAYQEFAAPREMEPLVLTLDERLGEAGAAAATAELLKAHPEIDGICAPVDAFAVGAAQAVADLGRRVGSDVRIATRYDGFRARQNRPPLTALDLHLDVMAERAVDLLLARIRGEDAPVSVAGPLPDLIVRESSRPD